ncbi:MAG: transketolase [Candidatus Paceibacterota bacterium]|jgi:transketolase
MNTTELRLNILEATLKSGEGHIPSAFSILDILWVLYDRVLKPRDHFILSKGHGALALYAVLAHKGKISFAELNNFAMPQSKLGGHPDCLMVPGVEASTGSLGHGVAVGCGMALAHKINGGNGRIYILVGDGECQEGSVWEASRIATDYGLNITLMVDYNKTHPDDNLLDKFLAFGWFTRTADGHDHEAIYKAFYAPIGPMAIIFNTVKGKGCKTFEENPGEWHRRAPKWDELEKIKEEIGIWAD